ncbi:hypothetical protein ABZX77_30895 [Streptomyces sp. NPDC004237]|uniref:hypothetical protein n=1 Tax=Streptomyces sp. NPDC004237 TaxID=3154455 RepID=UPI00339F021C
MLTQSSSTATAYMGVRITQGSTGFLTVNDEYAAQYGGPVPGSASTMFRVYGLTAGATCTVTAMHRSSDAAVTCWFDNFFLRADPAN